LLCTEMHTGRFARMAAGQVSKTEEIDTLENTQPSIQAWSVHLSP
jgi:hypothetical protein